MLLVVYEYCDESDNWHKSVQDAHVLVRQVVHLPTYNTRRSILV